MQRLEVSRAVRPIYGSLGVKRLISPEWLESPKFKRTQLGWLYVLKSLKLWNILRIYCFGIFNPVFYVLLTVHPGMNLVNNQLHAQFFLYVYFYYLHVSGSHVPIIRRIIVSVRQLVYVTLDYVLDGPGSNPGGDEIFLPYRPALGPTHPPLKSVPGLSRG